MSTCIIVGNVKGGVGKSTVAQLLISEADSHAPGTWKFIQIDDQRSTARDGGVMGRRVDVSIGAGADLADVEDDGQAALEHFDEVGDVVLSNNCVIDQGANVQRQFMRWMLRSRLPEIAARKGVRFRVVAVTDGTVDSLEGALWLVKNYSNALGSGADYSLVLNDRNGKGFAGALVDELKALVSQLGGSVIEIPYSRSKLLYEGLQRRLTPLDTYLQAETIGRETGLTDKAVRFERERCDLLDFLAEVRAAVSPLLPETKAEAA